MGKQVKGFAGGLEDDLDKAAELAAVAVVEFDENTDAISIAKALRPMVATELSRRILAGEVGSGDLIKLLGMLNDRIDGKVVEKFEHSGEIGIAAILAQIDGKTAGLPSLEDIEVMSRVVYDAEVVPALSGVGLDGGDIIKES